MKTTATHRVQAQTTSGPLIQLTDIRVVTRRKTQKPDRKRFISRLDQIVSSPSTHWTGFDQICAEAGL